MENHVSYETLMQRRDFIKRNKNFSRAITEHYIANEVIYEKQPLFYKTILQESRTNIILSVCCLIYGQKSTSVSDIKYLCQKYNIASSNSVIAVITFLRATNRIITFRCSEDRRKTMINPTPKGLSELKRYMSSAFIPLITLYPNYNISSNLLDNDVHRCNFFSRVSEYLFTGMTFKKTLPEVEFFINKDGGRMIMLYIYLQAMANEYDGAYLINYSASEFANKFFVSRVHVNRIIHEAQAHGYLEVRKDKRLKVSTKFIELVENYAGTYFSYVEHYLDIHPSES